MIGLLLASSPAVTTLSLYLTVLSLGAVALMFAPQPIVRDKRVIVAAVLILLFVAVGFRAQAVILFDPCDKPDLTTAEYWLWSCWLPAWMRF